MRDPRQAGSFAYPTTLYHIWSREHQSSPCSLSSLFARRTQSTERWVKTSRDPYDIGHSASSHAPVRGRRFGYGRPAMEGNLRAFWSSLVEEQQRHGRGLVLGVKFENRIEAAALFFEVVRFGCQPEPGAAHEGARAVEVADYDPREHHPQLVEYRS